MRQVQTRGGVFGAGGYGGGVFDGSLSGLVAVSGPMYEQAPVGLGATASDKNLVCIYMPYQCSHWNEYSGSQQDEIAAQAKLVNSQFQAQIGVYRKENACNGSKPGRMAGALKEKLIEGGGDAAKMDPDESVFGSQECAEWWRVFGKAPTVDDAKTLFGTQTVGPLKVTLENVCAGTAMTAPSCPKPTAAPPPAPPPVTPEVTPELPKKKTGTTTAWIVGGLLAAAVVAGVAVAAKKKH